MTRLADGTQRRAAGNPRAEVSDDDAQPLDYFEQVYEATRQAIEGSGPVARAYRIGGHSLRLVFAGDAMVPHITPALAHLESRAQTVDFTIYVWDSASTGARMPTRRWTAEDHEPRGRIRGFNTDRFRTANLPGSDGFSMLDFERNAAVHWDANAEAITYHERSFPLRVILSWWAARNGLQFAHAGAVGYADGGVLIVGKSGVGKSTTALACIGSGLLYGGDDHVLVRNDPEPYVYSLYNSAKLHARQVPMLVHLRSHVSNPERLETEKALFFVHQVYPEIVSAGFPVRAIVVPRVSERKRTEWRQISAATALAALAPTSMFLLPGEDRQAFGNLARFARQVACYELALGTDLSQIPPVIKELLARA